MINFKKISAIAGSGLMIGMTMGVAAAANYPAPFVAGGAADVAIVYGTGLGVSVLDGIQGGSIMANLQSFMGGSTSGSDTATTSGETVSLGTSSTRIWLNTSLNTAKSQLTKADLPTVLADYTFSGNPSSSKLTHTVKLMSGATGGSDGSGKVIFAKQPESNTDPVIGISMAGIGANILYNASATMSAINFTHTDSKGQELVLFGEKFTVASATDTNKLVLLKSAEKIDLSSIKGSSASVTVGEETYTVELVSASDSEANIKITDSSGNSESKTIIEAASKRVNGIDVAVINADESSDTNTGLSASVIVGSDKLTLQNGQPVTIGEDDQQIDGTRAYIVGGTGATTEIAISVFKPNSSEDAILPGESFVDPVFGTFKVDFAGLSSGLDDSGREVISITPSGDKDMEISLTDDSGNAKTFNFAHNESQQWRLGDNNNFSIATREMANLSYAAGKTKYVVVGNQDYGHLLEYYYLSNASGVSNDEVRFRDIITGELLGGKIFTSTEGSGTLYVDGKGYVVTFSGSGEEGWINLKYPSSEDDGSHSDTDYVVYPTIKTANGVLVAFYEPLLLNLANMTGNATSPGSATKIVLPDGDGYTSVAVAHAPSAGYSTNWTIGGLPIGTNATADTNWTTVTIGKLTYNFSSSGTNNVTKIRVANPEVAGGTINNPGVIILEGKDDDTNYHGIVVDLEDSPAGDSNNGVGVQDILFSSTTHWEATLASDSDITQHVDLWGSLASYDSNTASKAKATISYPSSQVYANIFIGASDSTVTGTGSTGGAAQLGDVLVKDSEISSVSSKNLVVVGGSCINSVAANLVDAGCGSAFTDSTGVGSGQFLIQSFGDAYTDGKIALLVAGYDASDTVNAAKYLRTQTVDTTAGKKYKGTTSTSAELQTTETTA